MKPLLQRLLADEGFALGVLVAAGYAAAEALLGDGLQVSDLPTVAAMFGAGMARLKTRA